MPTSFPISNGIQTGMAKKPPRLLNVRRESKGDCLKGIKAGEGEESVYPIIS